MHADRDIHAPGRTYIQCTGIRGQDELRRSGREAMILHLQRDAVDPDRILSSHTSHQ